MPKLKKRPITNSTGQILGYEAPSKDIQIIVCDKAVADAIIIKNHYSHKVTKNSFLSFLVYYKGKVEGALQVGYGIKPKSKGLFNPDEVREFDRMWLSDVMPKYSETITLSLLHHYLKKAHPQIKHLISYADTTVGNEGTIYKAANYKLIDKIKADFYILESGERVHPITMWHRHGTRKWDFLSKQYPNIKKAIGFQMKYLFTL